MKKAIAWFARNSVAANLLMIMIMASGAITYFQITQEVFPEFSSDRISISVPYLGAAPEEVEEAVCIRIEEQIQSLEGIKQIISTSSEGVGTVMVEADPGADIRELLDDIKSRVDAIDTFPEETEKPVIQEVILRRQVISIAIAGQADLKVLKSLAERVRDEVSALPGITQVQLANARPYEVSIEVSEDALRRWGLSFNRVAQAVRNSSLDLPGGSVKTQGGEVLLRTKGQAYRRADFERLVLLSRRDGTYITLGDVATVVDGFAETDQSARFDGKPAVLVQIFRVGDQSALEIAAKVKEYVQQARASMPEGIQLTTWQDDSKVLKSRLELLTRNGLQGLVVVLLILTLFLRLGLALWVSLGIPISFLGTLWMMPSLDVSINLMSLFAFIVVLGILVDDAIVVGEGIFSSQRRGMFGVEAARKGAQRVAIPVIFGVLTTVAAFSPLVAVEGAIGKVMRVIPLVVIPCLLFSLVESLLVLPSHLSHYRPRKDHRPIAPIRYWQRFQGLFADGLMWFARKVYRPLLRLAVRLRYFTVAAGVATLLLTAGLILGGRIRFVFLPDVEADNVAAFLTMPQGTPVEVTEAAVRRLEQTAYETARELEGGRSQEPGVRSQEEGGKSRESGARSQEEGRSEGILSSAADSRPLTPDSVLAPSDSLLASPPDSRLPTPDPSSSPLDDDRLFRHMLASIGEQPFRTAQSRNAPGGVMQAYSGSHLGEINIELAPSEERDYSSTEIANLWREKTGAIPDAVELTFTSSLFSPGEPVNVQLSATNLGRLNRAAEQLKAHLARYPGVYDITDSYRAGKQEIQLDIRPQAELLGLTLSDLARQVRQGFYGEEAQRIQRGRDEVKVMVRYPLDQRRSLGDIEQMRIRTPSGAEVAFSEVAQVRYGQGYSSIKRVDRQRSINVTANVDETQNTATDILADLTGSFLPRLMRENPGLQYQLEGRQREQREALQGLGRGYVIALLAIFTLLAVPLKSYSQPLIVMSAIPFGLVGATWGHVIMGMDLTILSGFGVVALAGVVVNDSLVMVDWINHHRKEGLSVTKAVLESGLARFRPIVLTSLTTFGGLTPLLLEKSLQAQFLIPMAVSLAFGVIFSTFVTLVLVPSGYLILEDAKRLFKSSPGPRPDVGGHYAAPRQGQAAS